VVLNHSQRGTQGYTPRCNHVHPRIAFPREGGGTYNEPVHPLTFGAWQAYITVMIHHGETMPGAGGVDQCRNIGDSDEPSLHAYLCACDLPPNSRKSDAFIRDIERIRTNDRAQAFRNLRGDRMHDQINCSPGSLGTGIDLTTVAGATGDDEMNALKKGDFGNGVRWYQTALNEKSAVTPKLTVDGKFGSSMERAVKQYQKSTGSFDENGVIDGALGPLIAKDHPSMGGQKGDKGDPGKKGDPGVKGDPGDDGGGLEPGDTFKFGTTGTVLP